MMHRDLDFSNPGQTPWLSNAVHVRGKDYTISGIKIETKGLSMKRKLKIGFLMINEHSPFNAAFGLARVLQERGHKVFFFVESGTIFPQYVDKNGFDTAIMEVKQNLDYRKKGARFRPWKWLKNHVRLKRAEQNCIAELLAENSVDLYFLDSMHSYPYAMVLAKSHIPTILFFPNFGSKLCTRYPPVFSSNIPSQRKTPNIRHRLYYSLLWIWAIITTGRRVHIYGVFPIVKFIIQKILTQFDKISYERKLQKLGWKSTWSEWSRRPIIPEIAAVQQSLDWDTVASNQERCYFGTTDLFRNAPDFNWSGIDLNRPIIYSNITTIAGFERIRAPIPGVQHAKLDFSRNIFHRAKQFIEVTIEAFSLRQDWQLILACGPFYHVLKSDSMAPNIHLFDRVSQLAVLSRADLAITWGGAGTIRECVNYAVPILVFPVWLDQFGNAARVIFHNVGIRGNFLNVTSKKMIEMVEQVLTDKSIRSSVDKFRGQSNVKNEIQELVDFVKRQTGLEI